MTSHTAEMSRFEFVRLSTLRVAQLIDGCTPRVPVGWKTTTTARREVSEGKVQRCPPGGDATVPVPVVEP